MDLFDRYTVINDIRSVKYFEPGCLEPKTDQELNVIRFDKVVKSDITSRRKYEDELIEINPDIFDKKKLQKHDFRKIKDYYCNFVLNRANKVELVDKVFERTSIDKSKLEGWSVVKLRDRLITMDDVDILNNLKEYGDGVTKMSTPARIKKQRHNFLVVNGSTNNSKIRVVLSKQISNVLKKMGKRFIYKDTMLKDIDILGGELREYNKTLHRNKLMTYLTDYGYTTKFLKKEKTYVLEYLKQDLQPCEKGSRIDLIRVLDSKNLWSRKTIRNWDKDKLKSAYFKNVRDNYSPLSEHPPATIKKKDRDVEVSPVVQHPRLYKSREQILSDISDSIFIYLMNE